MPNFTKKKIPVPSQTDFSNAEVICQQLKLGICSRFLPLLRWGGSRHLLSGRRCHGSTRSRLRVVSSQVDCAKIFNYVTLLFRFTSAVLNHSPDVYTFFTSFAQEKEVEKM